MSEEMLSEPVDKVEDTTEPPASPMISSVHKLREVSMAVKKLGEDLNQLVTVLEELSSMMKLFSGLGKKLPDSQASSGLPLSLLTSLLSKSSGPNEPNDAPDLNQLLFALLSHQLGQNK